MIPERIQTQEWPEHQPSIMPPTSTKPDDDFHAAARSNSSGAKVYVTSCETGEGAWRTHEYKLKEFHRLSDQRHELVNSPEEADIILLGNVREEEAGQRILANDLLSRWPERCFSLSDADHPLVVNRGIYASPKKSACNFGRARSGSYAAYADAFQNPYIVSHQWTEEEEPQKRYLFTFMGRNSHPCREKIFQLQLDNKDLLIRDTSTFDLWKGNDSTGDRLASQASYYEILLASKFALCPRGAGTNSLRLFEAMRLGIAPIIISDDWILPHGIAWEDCSIRIGEGQLDQLHASALEREVDWRQMGLAARAAYERCFAEDAYFNYVIWNCLDIRNRQWVPENLFVKLYPYVRSVRGKLRTMIKGRRD